MVATANASLKLLRKVIGSKRINNQDQGEMPAKHGLVGAKTPQSAETMRDKAPVTKSCRLTTSEPQAQNQTLVSQTPITPDKYHNHVIQRGRYPNLLASRLDEFYGLNLAEHDEWSGYDGAHAAARINLEKIDDLIDDLQAAARV